MDTAEDDDDRWVGIVERAFIFDEGCLVDHHGMILGRVQQLFWDYGWYHL